MDQYLTKVSDNKLLNTPGLQPLRKDLLELALKYHQEFIAEWGHVPDLQEDLADAYSRVGKITSELGLMRQAVRAHRKEIHILNKLVGANPTADDYQAKMATAYRNLGLRLTKTGATNEASAAYRKAH